MKNLLTQKLKEFPDGPIIPIGYDQVNIRCDQQHDIKNSGQSGDVIGFEPNHKIKYQKVNQNDNR